jgi:uncharacterized protein YndB with AHSA1/START domain
MSTRSQWHEIELPVPALTVFNLLLSPKAIRGRWNNTSAVVTELDGVWVIAWGQRENDPDYVSGARIKSFQAPKRVTMTYEYARSREGMLPFAAGMTAEFTIKETSSGALVRVTQAGLPAGEEAYFQSCADGWRAALQGLGTLLMPPASPQAPARR